MKVYAVMASSILDDYPYYPYPVSYHKTLKGAKAALESLDIFTDFVEDINPETGKGYSYPNGTYNPDGYISTIEVEEDSDEDSDYDDLLEADYWDGDESDKFLQ